MNNTRDVGNRLAPFFRVYGFTRKSNKFYKIKNNIAFFAGLERPGGLYSMCYIIPLYIPTNIPYLDYGCRLGYFDPFPVKSFYFGSDDPSQLEVFIERTMECCEKYFFPLYEKISTLEGLIEFLNQGYEYVKMYWCDMPLARYYELKIYTNFVLSRYDDIIADIPLLYSAVDHCFKGARSEWEERITKLLNFRFVPKEEKEEFIKNTVEHSIIACRIKE